MSQECRETPRQVELISRTRLYIFKRKWGGYYLNGLQVRSDGVISIGPDSFDLEGLKQAFDDGSITTAPPPEAKTSILNLGSFTIQSVNEPIPVVEFIKDVLIDIDFLNGRPDCFDRCSKAYYNFTQEPGDETFLLLKEAYEAVPAHCRDVILDMDRKDRPIRQILESYELKGQD